MDGNSLSIIESIKVRNVQNAILTRLDQGIGFHVNQRGGVESREIVIVRALGKHIVIPVLVDYMSGQQVDNKGARAFVPHRIPRADKIKRRAVRVYAARAFDRET